MVVAAAADLPRAIAGGGCASASGVGFPLPLADASAKCKPEEAYPVLVMGTQVRLLMKGLLETPPSSDPCHWSRASYCGQARMHEASVCWGGLC